jgi:hypothetical protein
VREADNLPPYSADVKKSRSLNSPRHLWASMACNGCALPLLFTSYSMRKVIVVYTETSVISYYTTYHHIEEDSNLLNYATHFEASYAWPILTHGGGTETCYIRTDVSVNRNKAESISLKF